MALPPGSRIGRYEILERLGAGGMGVVYRARDGMLDRTVAVKLLPAEFLGDPDRLRRFALEARATGRLNHPHIVAVFDAGVDGRQPFLVTELLEGGTLRARLSKGPLPLDEALALARQVAGALAAAHAQGIIHRDLKPENILITRDGSAKVLDFGLAKVASLSPGDGETHLSATVPGVALGTAGYMAPEQVAGRAVDHRADFFALGVVLHECLSGTHAFRRESVIDTLHAVLHDEPSDLPPAIPAATRQVIRRCLAKAPTDRFQTAGELELALEAAAAPSEATARGSTSTRRTARARRTAVALGVTLLLALLATAWTWTRSREGGGGAPGHATSIRAIAVLPLEDLSRERDQDYLVDSLTEALITDLSQIRALRVVGRTSVMRYRGSKRPLPEIARELGVSGIVEGTVLRVNDRLRVTARLIHAETEQHVWGEQYDRQFRDILALQSELAGTIADRIALQLTPGERARLSTPSPVNAASHEAYLRGRYFWNKRDPASLQLALEAFTSATRADPASARAWAGLGDTYFYLGYAFGRMAPSDAMPKARDAAKRALAIDARLAEAHTILGLVHPFYDWDRAAAEAELQRAIRLDPGYVLGHRSMAALLLTGRRAHAAIEHSREAVRLDPVSLAEHYFLGLCYRGAGEFDAAERTARKMLELEPGNGSALSLIATLWERRGQHAKAAEMYLQAAKTGGATAAEMSRLSKAYHAGGLRAFRDAELQGLAKTWDGWHFSAYLIATKQASAGHREEAYSWLRRARDARSAGIVLSNSEYEFERYRNDPAFREILGPAYTDGH